MKTLARAAAALISALLAGAALAQPADLVVRNARVWTGVEGAPDAAAVAVRGGRIVEVAPRGRALETPIGGRTRTIDAGGRRVIPGITDAHVHLAGAAQGMANLDLRPATSRADMLRRIREWSDDLAPGEWVLGRGWSAESWADPTPPTAEQIDEAAGGRPALLVRMDGHSALASATALEMAGIDAEGPDDPAGGRIGRLADGTPTGELFESAEALVGRLIPPPDPQRERELMREAMARAASLGVTQVGAIESRRVIRDVIAPIAASGPIPIRVAACVSEGTDDLDEWREILRWAQANPAPAPMVRVIGFKGYMDGSLGSRTAWMLEPFEDNPEHLGEDNAGFPLAMAESGDLRTLVHEGARTGLQPIVHAIGDRANKVALDWFAELPDAVRRRARPAIEHAQHLRAEDVPRFAELGVVPSMQPLHKADDGRYAEDRIGPDRVRTSYAFRDLLDSGATLAFGSDWPVVSVNPFEGIWAAVAARTTAGDPFLLEQAITVEEALVCYTRNAAYKVKNEDRTGTIELGKNADLVILDRDVLSVPHDQIRDVRALLTIVSGRVVHDAR